MRTLKALLALLVFRVAHVHANWQYRSRPDLSPPSLNITIPATPEVDEGYLFVAPYRGFVQSEGLDGPEQPGAYIFRDDGDLVWSGLGMLAGWVGNFQATRWRGMDVLQAFQGTLDSFHGHGYGHPTLLNQHYESVREIRTKMPSIISIHEFRIVNEKNALVEVFQPVAMDLSRYGGQPNQQWIADGIFQGKYFYTLQLSLVARMLTSLQEIDIETEEVLFEWSSLDHVDPNGKCLS